MIVHQRVDRDMPSMLNWFKEHRRRKRNAHDLYGSIVTLSRQPDLFRGIDGLDTVEGRFEILVAHMFLYLERLQREGEATRPLSQELVDLFFADMDTTMRELGVGDMAVPKKIKGIATAFGGRMKGYTDVMEQESRDPLLHHLAECFDAVPGPESAAAGKLAAYLHACRDELARLPVDDLHRPLGTFSAVLLGTEGSGR